MRIVVIAALFLAGCSKPNPHYCDPEDPDCEPPPCTTSTDTCVCKNPPGVCVMCTQMEHDACKGKTPSCGLDNVCHPCRVNDDCDSGACLDDGQCANANEIIYVAPNGVNTSGCGTMAGQNECSITQALSDLGLRTVIRLAPGMYTVTGLDGLDFNGKSGTVVARGATLKNSNGAIMTARNGGSLTLIGGTLQGPNGAADGIRCNTGGQLQVHETTIESMTQSGIETDGCALTISRALIRRNVQGGINMTGVSKIATIRNNFVYGNGQGITSPIGGMVLKLLTGSKVEFNTVVDNSADLNGPTAGGIACDLNGYDAPYNLVYRNTGGLGGGVQVIGMCTFQGSYYQPASVGENAVLFEDPNNSTNPSYRLTIGSPAEVKDRDVAGFDCSNLVDFEGDPRPFPAGGKCDCGADEYRTGQ